MGSLPEHTLPNEMEVTVVDKGQCERLYASKNFLFHDYLES